ncbi:MAG TPA: FAD binding domain-containing protein [Polyangiaceae bacterium]|nr:FAD binding domain-containing protein [Polyangiaceae bacterium]
MSLAQLGEIDWIRPRDLRHACEQLARIHDEGKKVWALCGCTDWMVERHIAPVDQNPLDAVALDISNLPELRGIRVDGHVMTIGAAQPYAAIRRDPMVREHCPMLAQMASEVGARQIQSRGTLGGNLVTGSPAADGVTALFALDATVTLQGPSHERSVPVTSFYSGYRTTVRRPDELVVRVSFELPKPGAAQTWRKVGTRKAQSISKAALAAVAETEEGVITRVGFGAASVAEVVLPLASVRSLVLGKNVHCLNMNDVEEAVDSEIRPIDDVRSTGRYRRHLMKVLVKRFLQALA